MIADRDPDTPDTGRRLLPSPTGRKVLAGVALAALALWGLSAAGIIG